jgi:hypothetical protein
VQKTSNPQVLTFLSMADSLGLGISDKEEINISFIDLG